MCTLCNMKNKSLCIPFQFFYQVHSFSKTPGKGGDSVSWWMRVKGTSKFKCKKEDIRICPFMKMNWLDFICFWTLHFFCSYEKAPWNFSHTHSPATQVDVTWRSLSNIMKSASAPKFRVPFFFSIPSTWAGCSEADSRASTVLHPAGKQMSHIKIANPSLLLNHNSLS